MAWRTKTYKKLRRESLARLIALFASAVIGALFWLSPLGEHLETNFGLWWSFKMRGPRAPPPEVVVVPITEESARILSQPSIDDLDEWDRALFAQVVDRLANSGASVIALDIAFTKENSEYPNGDDQFVEAIASAKNVVLMRWLEQRRSVATANNSIAPQIDRLIDPPRKFSKVAAAIAPWLLHEAHERINYFPTFPLVAARLTPTIPVVALYLHRRPQTDWWHRCVRNAHVLSAGDELASAGTRPRVDQDLLALRNWLPKLQTEESIGPLDTRCMELDYGWIARLFNPDKEKLFNYYGNAGTLVGSAFHQLVRDLPEPLAKEFSGKAVFIGVARDEIVQPLDSFHYPFRDGRGGGRISGVELAATAFANLLHDDVIRKIDPSLGLILLLVFGMTAGLIGYLLPARRAIAAAIFLCVLYVAWTRYLFATSFVWLPLIIPLLIQTPLAIAFGWQMRYLKAKHDKQLYGQYVPRHAKKQIDTDARISTEPQLMYAVCLHSDVAGYSGLAERFKSDPSAFKRLEKEYWIEMDRAIDSENGERLGISGDGMTCIWKDAPTPVLQKRACQASLKILRAIDRFNRMHPDAPFKTRIGLHAGEIALGNIGTEGNYTLAVGGDVATTAARLENDVNKLLGTRLAVSKEVLSELTGVNTRRLGRFILRGRTSETVAYELRDDHLYDGTFDLISPDGFEAALAVFDGGQWREALNLFDRLLAQAPRDGPTLFYHRLVVCYLKGEEIPPRPRDPGMIDMNKKSIQALLSG